MTKSHSTRRSFLKGGALVAAPLAAAGAAAVVAENQHKAKLERLEAEAAVRALHQDFMRKVNTGDRAEAARLGKAVTGLAPDHQGAPDEIRLAADGLTATGRFALVVETATELARDCTLAQMAHVQGEGWVRSSAPGVVKADYVKAEGGWTIAKLRLEAV
jgi:hypothetical protein